jgi:hypothetical protein
MKLLIILLFLFHQIFACDWATIEEKDGNYIYSKDCHIEVGRLVAKEKYYLKEIDVLKELNSSHKELLMIQMDRTNLWKDYSQEIEQRYTSVKRSEKLNFWINFGLGIAVTSLSVYLASGLAGR